MEGYVLNATSIWSHTMKRAVGPGMKIPLGELYEQYGVKHGLSDGDEFVEWLRSVKLKDDSKWKIVLETPQPAESQVEKPTIKEEPVNPYEDEATAPHNTKDMQIKDVIGLSVRRARDVVPSIMDLKLLQYAEKEANQLAGKDSLCRILRKRIRELQTMR